MQLHHAVIVMHLLQNMHALIEMIIAIVGLELSNLQCVDIRTDVRYAHDFGPVVHFILHVYGV